MVHPKRSVFDSNQVQGVSEEPQPSGIDPDCRTLFLRGKSVDKGAQIGRSRTLFWATSSKSKTCISELRQDFFDRSVSNHISQPSSGNLAAQNALRRLVERERKGSHTLPPLRRILNYPSSYYAFWQSWLGQVVYRSVRSSDSDLKRTIGLPLHWCEQRNAKLVAKFYSKFLNFFPRRVWRF